MDVPTTSLRLQPLGRLWQEAWLDDVRHGGPLRFADWLAGLPDDLDAAGPASWRVDLVVAEAVPESGAPVVVEPLPDAGCLPADAVLLVEAVLEDLAAREIALEESVDLLAPVVAELADAADWPVPPGLRGRLESLATRLAGELARAGADVREAERLLAVPASGPAPGDDLDLDRVAAVCLAVPRGVLASRPGAGAAP